MTQVDYKELKKNGFLRQVQKDSFSLRIKLVGGQIGVQKLQKVSELAEKFGKGYVHLTSRQAIEIPFIKLQDVEAVKVFLVEAGLSAGVLGARMRTITACQGNAVCVSGLINTSELARECDEKYQAWELPHKFKLGITGCRNNCLKAEENDLGIKGGMKPSWDEKDCNYCGVCQKVCPVNAIQVSKHKRQLEYDKAKCITCGRCVKACPTKAWKGKSGYILYFGGTFGNRIAPGKQLLPLLFSKTKVHRAIEVAMQFYKTNGKASERFGATLDRVGWDLLKKDLLEAK